MHRPANSVLPLLRVDSRALRMLKLSAFERRRGGWRFGTKRIGDVVVERLIARGSAVQIGDRVVLAASAQGGR